MLTTGYTKIGRVIENVIRDTGFTSEIHWVDVVEWVFIASELIGVKNAYVLKITDGNTTAGHPEPLAVVDYRVELPADFHLLEQLREYDSKMPLRATHYSYLISNNKSNYVSPNDMTYTINEDYIFTSFEEGNLELAYYAFPTDTDGLPLIPDDVMYLRAVEAYITERIARKLWIQDKIGGDKYRALEQDWLFYVNSARTKDALMSIDQAESFRGQISKLVTSSNQHSTQYINLGTAGFDREIYKNGNVINVYEINP